MGITKRAGWMKRGFNVESHLTPARAAACKRNSFQGGRPRSIHYKGIAALNVGSSELMPWRLGPDGLPAPRQQWAAAIIRRVSARTGRVFSKRGGATGLIVTRIK